MSNAVKVADDSARGDVAGVQVVLRLAIAPPAASAPTHGETVLSFLEVAPEPVPASPDAPVGAKPACLYDAYETAVYARGQFGPVSPSILDEVSFSDEELDTDKPWRIADWVLDVGLRRLAPGELEEASWAWRAPEPLGDPRLERIVQALRAGGSYERVEIAGRQALRVREIDGAVATAFLSDAELTAVIGAIGLR